MGVALLPRVLGDGSSSKAVVVDHVDGPTTPQSDRSRVILSNGEYLDVVGDPIAVAGEPVTARYDSCGCLLGYTARGSYVPAASQPEARSLLSHVSGGVLLFALAALGAVVALAAQIHRWARRDVDALTTDLGAPPHRVTGRYVGSYVAKGLPNRHSPSAPPGIPVAIATPNAGLEWFSAPASQAARLKALEIGIKDSDRLVTLDVAEHSGVLLSISTSAGVNLDLRPDIDDDLLREDTGLPLPSHHSRH